MKSYRQNETKNQRKDRKRAANYLDLKLRINAFVHMSDVIGDYKFYVDNARIYGSYVALTMSAARESARRAMMLAKAGKGNEQKRGADPVNEIVVAPNNSSTDASDVIKIINDDETLSFKLEQTTWKEPGND